MAKGKSSKMSAAKPASAPVPYTGPSFSEIEDEILDWVNTLQSVCVAMDQSAGIDGCEIGSPARNAAHLRAKNLHRLASGLEAAVRHG